MDDSHIYWIQAHFDQNHAVVSYSIARANLDSSSIERDFITGVCQYNCGNLAVDDSHIYWQELDNWTNPQLSATWTIARGNLDGSFVQEDFITPCGNLGSLALDGSHIYWQGSNTDSLSDLGVGRANLDSSSAELAFIPHVGGDGDYGLAVDSSHIYWLDHDASTNTESIARANLDGTFVQRNFITNTGTQPYFSGLAVG